MGGEGREIEGGGKERESRDVAPLPSGDPPVYMFAYQFIQAIQKMCSG